MQTEAVRLRPTSEDDLDFVLATEQHEENSPYVGQWPRERHLAACTDPDSAHLIIERIGSDRPGGYVILGGLTSPDDCVELRRIVVADKGQRLGKTAIQLIKRFVFEELGAHRLWFDVQEHNIRARRLYESEGFLVEGTLRDANRAGDRYESLVVMSMLEHEYQT